jgi:glycosyltransferase involved in cell wall biosynthesis
VNILEHSHVAPSAQPLRIAMVAPPWYEVPPRGYGGIEVVVAELVDALVERGHEVVLLGSGEHGTRADSFLTVFDEAPSELLGDPVTEVTAAATVGRLLADLEVDLVHDHSFAGPLLARGRGVPTVVTTHGPVTDREGDLYAELGETVGLVSISRSQRESNPGLNWLGTVHNALDVASFPFREHKDDYLLWLGRFSADKAPALAIDVARRAGVRIVLAGKLNEPAEEEYFDAEVKGRLGPDAEYVGEADADLKRELLGGARALLFPIQWDEPFGMVMLEAMACGTPVVATRRGSVPEVVEDGRTGIVVDDEDDLVEALDRARSLRPADCRASVEERFSPAVMAEGYERMYRAAIGASLEPLGRHSAA